MLRNNTHPLLPSQAHEFAERVRDVIRAKIPSLASRMYRPIDANDPVLPHLQPTSESMDTEWNFADAERRIKEAWEKGGLVAWGIAAMREAEEEDRVKRSKDPRTSGDGSAQQR